MSGATEIETDTGRVDVGILILLPDPLARQVSAVRESVGDDPGQVPAHITLVPPTPVAASDLPVVLDRAREVGASTPVFDVELTGTDTFEPVSQVAFVTVGRGAEQCDVLQGRLREGPLGAELRFPYHPHVTLAHDVPEPGLERAQQAMEGTHEVVTVDSFVVFTADPGGHDWRQAARVPLRRG